MIARRDLLLGGLGVAAAAAAEALRPRRRLILLKSGMQIERSLPVAVGKWSGGNGDGLITPDMAGTLARTLYREIVAKTYYDEETGAGIMLLAAYGDTQSDLLQVHRPELCYAAVGFEIASSTPYLLPLSNGARLPTRRVVAKTRERTENIVYWTRMGETLPQSSGEQRRARFLNAVNGFVADGILVRFSMVGPTEECFAILEGFIPQFISKVAPDSRAPLIGTPLADGMKA